MTDYLSKLETDSRLKEALSDHMVQHMPAGYQQDGTVGHNSHVLMNTILNFARDEGMIARNNSINSISLAVGSGELKLPVGFSR